MPSSATPPRPPAPPQDFPLPQLQLRRFRYEKITEVRIDDEIWSEWVLYWLPRGGGVLEVDGVRHDLEPRRVFVVSPYTRYNLVINGRPGAGPGPHYRVEMAPITRDETEADLLRAGLLPHFFAHFTIGDTGASPRSGVHRVELDAPLLHQLAGAQSLLRACDQSRLTAANSCRLASLVLEVVGRIPPRSWSQTGEPARIGWILHWMETHLGEDLGSASLARRCGLSLRTFNRRFREETRLEPQEAVRAARVRGARRLLLQTDESIDRIAELCGFRDRYYFSRVFKQRTGIAPACFRNLNKR